TGGFLPLAAAITTDAIYRSFYDEWSSGKAFLHSHSYTGNPIACAAALATLSVFRDEPVIDNHRILAAHAARALQPLRDHPNRADVRQTGMIAAVEIVAAGPTKKPFPTADRRGRRAYSHALSRGVLLRPLGDIIYFMPPYCVTTHE